MYINCFI